MFSTDLGGFLCVRHVRLSCGQVESGLRKVVQGREPTRRFRHWSCHLLPGTILSSRKTFLFGPSLMHMSFPMFFLWISSDTCAYLRTCAESGDPRFQATRLVESTRGTRAKGRKRIAFPDCQISTTGTEISCGRADLMSIFSSFYETHSVLIRQ